MKIGRNDLYGSSGKIYEWTRSSLLGVRSTPLGDHFPPADGTFLRRDLVSGFQLDSENVRKARLLDNPRPGGTYSRSRHLGAGNEIQVIGLAQQEQKIGLFVVPRSHAVQGSGYVLAHFRPVRTRAFERDLLRCRKEAGLLTRHRGHYARR